jgi:hypothetical protein
MKGKNPLFFMAAILLGLLLGSGPAPAGTANFDNLTPNSFFELHTDGVTFSSDFFVEVVNNPSLAVTPPNVLNGISANDYNPGTNLYLHGITMVFDRPQFYATLHLLDFTMSSFADLSVKGFELRAFDQSGTLADRDRFLFDQPTTRLQDYKFTGDKRFTVAADGIKSLSFDAIIDMFGDTVIFADCYIDNLAFTSSASLPTSLPPVPIPGSLLLLGSGFLGMLGLTGWRKK